MLELRLLCDKDILLVENWLNKKHVKRWYEIPHLNITIDDWMSEIKGRNEEFQWLTMFIVLCHDRPIGFCQYYKCVDSDEYFGSLALMGAYGIDYLIGEAPFLGKGLGKEMVNLLVELIFSLPDAQRVTADINKDNKASKKTLLANGFKLLDGELSRYVIEKKEV